MVSVELKGRFQLYIYTASHSQALFRSLGSFEDKKRAEILFSNVDYMSLPTVADGFGLLEIEFDEARKDIDTLMFPVYSESRFFRLFGSNWSGFIVAGNVAWLEYEAAYGEDSRLLVGPYAGGSYVDNSFRTVLARFWFVLRTAFDRIRRRD